MTDIDLKNPEFYINRELSLLQFNRRVLDLAQDESVPLLERLKYLCISSSNLDEFFEIRVAGVKQQLQLGISTTGADGLLPHEQFHKIQEVAHELVHDQYRVLNKILIPELAEEGIRFLRRTHWNPEQARWIKTYFTREVLPVLSPLGLDPAHPFPRILNKSLNFIVTLEGKDAFGRENGIAIVQAPRSLPRIIRLSDAVSGAPYDFVFLSSIIHAYVEELFPGMKVTGCYQFRVTRNSDLFVDEEEAEDLLSALEGELPSRNYGDAVRLEVADNCNSKGVQFLLHQFKLSEEDLYQVHGPVNLRRLMAVPDLVDRPDLKFPAFTPSVPAALQPGHDIFEAMSESDILLHHPYQSFNPIVDLICQAASDPNVLAIKQTLYRTGEKSVLVDALVKAASSGKEVTVIIELRARFDEEANIQLASRLQDAGAHVVYGVVGYKTHAKLTMIVRREGKRVKRYVHLGTGNYHAGTARAYTDIGLLSADKTLGEDVHKIFQQLTGLGKAVKLKKLLHSPFTLHKGMLDKIDRETEHARQGKKTHIMARMNSLIEPQVIQALYRASQAGVKVELLVRGICALRPGIAGVSDNIQVRSVMGRFLEHSRVFYFLNDGESEVFGSSADWMPRNFFRRVETCFPVEKPDLHERVVQETLAFYFQDNTNAWILKKDGSYQRVRQGNAQARTAQQRLLELLSSA
jgi:polyphosphate kinase